MAIDVMDNNYLRESPCLTCELRGEDKNDCAPTCEKLYKYRAEQTTGLPFQEAPKKVAVASRPKPAEVQKLKGSEVPCIADGCEKLAYSRGLCRNHYDKWRTGALEHPVAGVYKRKYRINGVPSDRPSPGEVRSAQLAMKISLVRYPKVMEALVELADSSIYPIEFIVVSLLAEGLESCHKNGKYDFNLFKE